MKKLFSFALAALLLLSAFVSCAETAETGGDETTAAASVETTAEGEQTSDGLLYDNLPARDYDGYAFNFYTRTNTTHYAFLTEEMTGEVLNDALYERNAKIGDRFNVVFTEIEYSDEGMPATVVQSGDDSYSLMNVRCTAANTMAQKNYCLNISALEYIDLDKGYWDEKLTNAIAVGSKVYTAIGDTNLTAIDFMNVLLFNKQMIADYGLDNPYDLVDAGTWTFDAFGEMGAAVSQDLDGDGKMNSKDQWGILGVSKYTHCSLIQAAGELYIDKDEDGYPYFDMATDERFINVFEKIFAVCNDNGAWYNTSDNSNEGTSYHNMFRNNQGLFLSTMFYYIETMRDMEYEFGIIPYPKYDAGQESYYNRISFFDTCVIPTSTSDVERTSIILEALTCESHNTVIPAYYEIALKTKYARDEESQRMIDIIMDNRVLDYGDTYFCSNIRDGFVATMFVNDNHDIVSAATKQAKSISKLLEKMVAAYEELDG